MSVTDEDIHYIRDRINILEDYLAQLEVDTLPEGESISRARSRSYDIDRIPNAADLSTRWGWWT